MIQERQPEFAAQVVRSLEEGVDTPALHAAASCAIELTGVMGFAPPSWSDLALGARPPPREAEDLEPGAQRRGWQHEASSRVERRHRSVILFPQLTEADKALTRSQSGTGAGVALTTTPSNLHTGIEPQLFRVLLFRRLRLPLPFSRRFCRCGRLLDSLGHHRAACSRVGVLGRRGFALESAAAKICREAGGRVATNLFVRDLDVNVPGLMDNRRLEVVADGLPLFAGAQLAVDITLVCPLHADGNPPPPGPPGFHTTARELQTCTLEGPGASKTPPKFHERTPKREKKERQLWREREEKSAKFCALQILCPPPFWAPPFWAPQFKPPLFLGLGPHPERPPPFGRRRVDLKRCWPKARRRQERTYPGAGDWRALVF